MLCGYSDFNFNMDGNNTAILDCLLEANGSADDFDFFANGLHICRGSWGKTFSAYVTPFIIAIGLAGNLISLRVFTSTQLRKLSASFYLAALSASDTIVLLTYVLGDWLMRRMKL